MASSRTSGLTYGEGLPEEADIIVSEGEKHPWRLFVLWPFLNQNLD
jgi:hypothetical protein